MSFSQQNRRLNEEPEYRYAFLTTKNGNSTRRFRTCTFVNLQFSFFSVPIWSGRMFKLTEGLSPCELEGLSPCELRIYYL